PRLELHLHGALVFLNDAVAHREPETRPGGLRRVERIEDPRERFRGDAGARVPDHETQPARTLWDRSRLDPDLAALGHGLAGIREEVHEHLLEGRGVAADGG